MNELNSTQKEDSIEVSPSVVNALRETVETNLKRLENVDKKEDISDKTYKELSNFCDVDFRTIKRWILGETRNLGEGPFKKIRDYINKSQLFHIEQPARLFSWSRQSEVTHVIFTYHWGTKTFIESKDIFETVESQIRNLLKGYKEDKKTRKRLDLLAEYEEKSFAIYKDWSESGVSVSAARLPKYSYPEELMERGQNCLVAAFSISTQGMPISIYEAQWEDVEPL